MKLVRKIYFRKFEVIVPVFIGCLCSLILSAQVMSHHVVIDYLGFPMLAPPVQETASVQEPMFLKETVSLQEMLPQETVLVIDGEEPDVIVTESIHHFARKPLEHRDLIQELYREPETRDRVIDFFAEICDSREIAEVILVSADMYNIAPALALALAWEESRLNPHAVNTKNRDNSIDRGLFQLNNRSFPRLEIQAFFNPELNAQYGMGHLRYCLDTGGSEIAALAMYNAGTIRVSSTGTPKTTLDYINRILENRKKIENRFAEQQEPQPQQPVEPPVETVAEAPPEPPRRLVPLVPLASIR